MNWPSKISRTIEKLKNKEEVKIVGLGDSVLEGCSSSKKFNHEPYMDTFIEMVKDNLSSLYGTTVNLKNLSVQLLVVSAIVTRIRTVKQFF